VELLTVGPLRPFVSRLAGVAVASVAMLLVSAGAAAAQFQEYQVKAAYLYKFVPFVDWPANAFATPTSPLQLCLAGEDRFGSLLDRAVANQRLGARPLQLRRIDKAEKAAGCHVVYVGGSRTESVAAGLAVLRGKPVLTVTDGAIAGTDRGVIHFVARNNNIRFEIDDQAAARQGLTISSKLLSLAVAVKARS
jgi:hypothetical protein